MRSNRLRAALEVSARRLVLPAAVPSVGDCLLRFSPLPDQAPPLRLSHPAAQPAVDGRAPFRQIVCMLADQRLSGNDSCERLIWRLKDEPPPVPPNAPPPALDPKIRVLIVPGAFAECFPEYGMPFEHARFFSKPCC